jgi:hypothetical protein
MKKTPVPVRATQRVAARRNSATLRSRAADKTVAQQADPLRASFGADAAKETDLKLDE